ncbi:MAG: ATP-binding protein, partial [Bdellovibrio sp.]|nr:ATP-binding protein [Bdellovibrio sp.]
MIACAVAGFHHVLLLGPKGVGKSHALEWGVALQPQMLPCDRLFHQLIEELGSPGPRGENRDSWTEIRRVGAQTRVQALTGGVTGLGIFPGEFSLAHGGLLLADELPEWSRDSREVLREPLERGWVTVNRVKGTFEFPAKFQLLANGNLCPCGGVPTQFPKGSLHALRDLQRCRCRPAVRDAYISRLSGPIIDRIDITLLVCDLPKTSREVLPSEDRLKILMEKTVKTRETLNKIYRDLPGQMEGDKV